MHILMYLYYVFNIETIYTLFYKNLHTLLISNFMECDPIIIKDVINKDQMSHKTVFFKPNRGSALYI